MINRAIEILKNKYKVNFSEITISEIEIGVYMTGIKLSDNSYGVAGTNISHDSQCYRDKRDYDIFSTNNIIGQNLNDLFYIQKSTKIIDGLKVAALNALSSKIINTNNYNITENTDPIELLDLSNFHNITVVGAFQSYIRKLKIANKNFKVLELDKEALKIEDYKYYAPADTYVDVFASSDLIIITGSTLVNNTLENILDNIPNTATVIVTGPSGSIVPDVLFEKGVDIIGATKIIDSNLMMKLVAQAATGFHFFKHNCAQKICVTNKKSDKNA